MSQVNSIHHINYVVKDLTLSADYFSRLFNCEPITEVLSKRGVKTARYPVGDAWFVLVQPLNNHGEVARILAQRGEGLFLLSFGVDDLSNTLDDLQTRGILPDEKGARAGLDTWTVNDIQPPFPLSCILQLCQDSK